MRSCTCADVARAHRRHAHTHFAEHLLRSEPGHVKLRNCDLLAAVRRRAIFWRTRSPISNRTGWTGRNQAIAAKQSRLRRPDQSNPAKQCRLRAVKAFAYKSHLSVVRYVISYATHGTRHTAPASSPQTGTAHSPSRARPFYSRRSSAAVKRYKAYQKHMHCDG